MGMRLAGHLQTNSLYAHMGDEARHICSTIGFSAFQVTIPYRAPMRDAGWLPTEKIELGLVQTSTFDTKDIISERFAGVTWLGSIVGSLDETWRNHRSKDNHHVQGLKTS